MTDLASVPAAPAGRGAAPAKASGRSRRRWLRPAVAVPASILFVLVAAGLLAPVVAPYSAQHASLDAVLAPYGRDHLLGGDASGRDVFSSLLHGIRPTITAALVAVGVAVALGVPAGLAAGYHGSWFDAAASWAADALLAAPAIVILLTLAPAFGSSTPATMTLLGVLMSAGFFRLTRNCVRAVRNELYIDAARVSGLSDQRIMARHITRVVRGPLIIAASMTAGIAIVVQAGLRFLGVGSPQDITWGTMLSDAFGNIGRSPSLIYPPGIAIGITVACLAVLGSAVADNLERPPATAPRRAGTAGGPGAGPDAGSDAGPVAGSGSGACTDDPDAVPRPRVPSRSQLESQSRSESPSGSGFPSPLPSPGDAAALPEDAVLVVGGLRVAYPDPATGTPRPVVHDVSLHIRPGEVLGLVGESGSGKSQTAFAVLGLLPDTATVEARELRVTGRDPRDTTARERQALLGTVLGYVPQEPLSNLDPCFTVGHQLTEPMRTHLRLSRKAARDKAEALLREVGITDPAGTMAKYPHQISGGMAQRVLIAGAIACDPRILIADEPTTALDVTVQAEVLELLRNLRERRNLAVLLVTHNLGVVADLCDRVAVMRHGRIVENRPVRDLFTAPRHDHTRALLSAHLAGTHGRAPYRPEARTHAR